VLPSSDLPSCTSDKPALVRNLRQLAMLAIPLNIKIAYQGWLGSARLLPAKLKGSFFTFCWDSCY
jgi:hypothetical protein